MLARISMMIFVEEVTVDTAMAMIMANVINSMDPIVAITEAVLKDAIITTDSSTTNRQDLVITMTQMGNLIILSQ